MTVVFVHVCNDNLAGFPAEHGPRLGFRCGDVSNLVSRLSLILLNALLNRTVTTL
jgi:hypothetical protein